MLEHADTALERWLCAALDVASVDFVESVDAIGSTTSKQPKVAVVLVSVSERPERRDTEVNDIRSADGRVTARQRSLRYFDVDYRVSIPGDARRGHLVLGRLLQALVDAETIEHEHLPDALRTLEVPIEIGLPVDDTRETAAATGGGVGLVVRLVVPVAPTPSEEIAPPAVELHLDMSPPPGAAGRQESRTEETTQRFLGERTWTTVRRREAIAPVTTAANSPEGSS